MTDLKDAIRAVPLKHLRASDRMKVIRALDRTTKLEEAVNAYAENDNWEFPTGEFIPDEGDCGAMARNALED